MKTKNDLKTGILIGIGMIVVPLIIMSSKPITSNYSTPESHVWELVVNDAGQKVHRLMWNKKTGEIREIVNHSRSTTMYHVINKTK